MFKNSSATKIDDILVEIRKCIASDGQAFDEDAYRASLQKQFKHSQKERTYKLLFLVILITSLFAMGFQYGKQYSEDHILPSKIEQALKYNKQNAEIEAFVNRTKDRGQ